MNIWKCVSCQMSFCVTLPWNWQNIRISKLCKCPLNWHENTHWERGTLLKGSTMDRDVVTWCNEWWRILLGILHCSSSSVQAHSIVIKNVKKFHHALTLLKPSVFSWLELLIKVMDRILFLSVQFLLAAFNLFYSSNGFQWWWKNMKA